MGQPILKASDVPTKLTANKDQAAVKAKLDVDGSIWNVTCVSMGNPHCVTFGTESCNVCPIYNSALLLQNIIELILLFRCLFLLECGLRICKLMN